jgi:hypothetical protein
MDWINPLVNTCHKPCCGVDNGIYAIKGRWEGELISPSGRLKAAVTFD